MSNVRFLYDMKFDATDVVLTASSETDGLPASNVVQEFVARMWRAESDGPSSEYPEWVKFDLGAAKTITMLAIFGHNLSASATVTIQASNTDSWTAPSYSTTMTWNELALVKFTGTQSYQWWRITFVDPANEYGYIEIGRICAGEYYEPGVNVTESVTKTLADPSTIEESDGRHGWAVEKPKYRTFGVQFTDITRTQQDELEDIFRAIGVTRPLVFALDPANYPEEDTIYCKMKGDLSRALKALEYGDVSLTFEEKR